jgi:hypothetical protein
MSDANSTVYGPQPPNLPDDVIVEFGHIVMNALGQEAPSFYRIANVVFLGASE